MLIRQQLESKHSRRVIKTGRVEDTGIESSQAIRSAAVQEKRRKPRVPENQEVVTSSREGVAAGRTVPSNVLMCLNYFKVKTV